MTDQRTSDRAFPAMNDNGYWCGGMTLRDYFAAKAMQGLLSSDVYAPVEKFATQAYVMADEMMKARGA